MLDHRFDHWFGIPAKLIRQRMRHPILICAPLLASDSCVSLCQNHDVAHPQRLRSEFRRKECRPLFVHPGGSRRNKKESVERPAPNESELFAFLAEPCVGLSGIVAGSVGHGNIDISVRINKHKAKANIQRMPPASTSSSTSSL